MKLNDRIKDFFSDWPAKLCCLLFAICVVFMIRLGAYGKRVVEIPLQVRLPEGYTALNKLDEAVQMTIQGSKELIYLVDPARISAVADFSGVDQETLASFEASGRPLSAQVALVYPDGLLDLSDEVVLIPSPSSVRILLGRGR